MSEHLHISSLLVTAQPDLMATIITQIEALGIAEIAQSNEMGKVVVALETPNESAIVQALTDIQLFDGVVNASLVFHHSEPLEKMQAVPSALPPVAI